jgi:WD40 repeat protein
VSITWAPSYGIAVVDPLTGHVTYAPGANFFGSDSFRYRVKDNEGLSSDEAIVSITVNSINDSPLASAGSDQTVRLGSVAQLNASASSDLDNDPLSYRWIQTDGSPIALIDGNSAAPSFIPMKAGRYGFDLVVSDGEGESIDSVVIDVPVFGDLNGDGYVNTADLQRLLTVLDSASGGLNDPFDLDGDGWISVEDLRRLVRSYTRQRMGLPVR